VTANAISKEAAGGARHKTPAADRTPPSHRSIERLAAIVESSDDAIIAKTLDGIITDWNQGAQRLFGYTADEAVGQPIYMLIPPDRLAEEADILGRIGRGEHIDHYQTQRLTKDGRTIHVMLTVSPIRDKAGKVVGASKIARDVTDLHAAEESLKQHAAALARSNEELERYAYITSHDLQEPLRTVASFAALLRQRCGDQLKGEAEEYLRFITDGVERMRHMIRDLLTYSRIESHAAALAPVDCNLLVRKVLDDLKAAIESERATIRVNPLPTVIADATQLSQVFQNLLMNAIKFHHSRCSAIGVSAVEERQRWVFSVTDNGIGIAPDYFDRIFIIFQRLHTAEEYGGTGIGLAVCKKIIERHHGKIWVESVLGEGSTFFFSIPKTTESP